MELEITWYLCIEETAPLHMYYAFWALKHEWLIRYKPDQIDI